MPSLEETLQQLAEGGADEEALATVRKAFEASPIRKERDEAQAKATALENRLAEQNFAAVGVKVKPAALNVPSDLDVTDVEKVRGWATDMGLVEAKPDSPPEELETHQRIAAAATGASHAGTPPAKRDLVMSATSEDDFWSRAQAAGLTAEFEPTGTAMRVVDRPI